MGEGEAGVVSDRYEEGTVMLLVSATMKKPPSGTKGLRPAVVRASIRRELRWNGGRGRKGGIS
jgi:hypothetical protein